MAILVLTAALSVRMAESAPFAAIVADARTGEILHSENANTRLHPASLTKMLTLYIAFDAVQRGEISLDTMVVVSKNAAAQPPSRLGLRAGQRIALRHLIRAAALRSGNDAASAIGDALSGSEAAFAERMNRTARALGMKNSTFKNANGLTAAGHLSTAADMNHLGRRLFYDFPQYYNIFSRRSDDAGVARVTNTNSRFLAAYKGADGIKTGYTNAAGFNLTASAERGNRRIIATVFGGKSTAHRNARMAELMDLGFRTAPGTAKVRKPPPVDLPAEALASAAASGARASGKTIRLVTAVSRSIRPRPRPGDPGQADAAAELVMAMQDSIEGALALATDPPPASDAPAALLAPATAPRPAAQPEALPFAVADAADAPAAEADADLPFELVEAEAAAGAAPPAEASAETPAETIADAGATPSQEGSPALVAIDGPSLRPTPRPGRAEATAETVLADAAADPDATLVAESAGATAQPAILQAAASAPPQRPATDSTIQPEGEIVALMAPIAPAAAAPAPPPEPEVVTRVSTSGGRHWAINLGRFNTRSGAERVLMRTALSESVVLRESLRKVVQRQGGYEANFVGLTQDQADLACRRLQARAVTCFTLGP